MVYKRFVVPTLSTARRIGVALYRLKLHCFLLGTDKNQDILKHENIFKSCSSHGRVSSPVLYSVTPDECQDGTFELGSGQFHSLIIIYSGRKPGGHKYNLKKKGNR